MTWKDNLKKVAEGSLKGAKKVDKVLFPELQPGYVPKPALTAEQLAERRRRMTPPRVF